MSRPSAAGNAEQLELAKQEERLQSLRESHDRQTEDERQFAQQAEEAERRLQQVVADRRRVALHILNTNARLAESLLEAESVARQAGRIGGEKEALCDAARRIAAGRSRPSRRAPPDERPPARPRSQARELRQQMESLSQRIEEEYQVRLADVVGDRRVGVSALPGGTAEHSRRKSEQGVAK